MTDPILSLLSRRERQVMSALFQCAPATVSELQANINESLTYSAVRSTLRVLSEKGHVTRTAEGRRHVYGPTVRPDRARKAALRDLVSTFFDGSAEQAAAALLRMSDARGADAVLERLREEIERTRGEGR